MVFGIGFVVFGCAVVSSASRAADHNDPIAINSIFGDVAISAADLYDLFGFPSDDRASGEKVVIALTFASMPATGVFDPDMLYVIKLDPDPRIERPAKGEHTLEDFLANVDQVKDRFLKLKASEIRVSVGQNGQATVNFLDFPSEARFTRVLDTNKVVTITTPGGHAIKTYIGGRDDAFFNDLPGFFRSINYAPQFYKVPQAVEASREIKIPKTLLELEGNKWFNFDPARPDHGHGLKLDLPREPMSWSGDKFFKDAKGKFRFVYSGRDAQAGINVNAIVFEIPLAFLTKTPETERVVNTWGESWVRKAASKIETIPDELARRSWLKHPWVLPGAVIVLGVIWLLLGVSTARRRAIAVREGETRPRLRMWVRPVFRVVLGMVLVTAGVATGVIWTGLSGEQGESLRRVAARDPQMKDYKLVDTDGVPFSDAALSERLDERQLGANNIKMARQLVIRTAHLGWGFGPSITALGLRSSFDHDDAKVSMHKEPRTAIETFPRVKRVLFQELNMPDDSWNRSGKKIPLKRGVDIFLPNVCAIDMDTTGTWPFGRRLEDQVATRFLSIFLDMNAEFHGKKYNVETLADQSLWDAAPIEPKTPPNPLKNDKEFLKEFPYLADPWPTGGG